MTQTSRIPSFRRVVTIMIAITAAASTFPAYAQNDHGNYGRGRPAYRNQRRERPAYRDRGQRGSGGNGDLIFGALLGAVVGAVVSGALQPPPAVVYPASPPPPPPGVYYPAPPPPGTVYYPNSYPPSN